MFRKCTLAACMVLVSGISVARGQDAVLDELYGRGVHQYFAHDYLQAYNHFSMAIDNGSQDPRTYYFRGLTLLATGREDEALNDWRVGAGLEAGRIYAGSIGRSLARVQGQARLQLEHIRKLARLEALAQETARAGALYGNGAQGDAVPLSGAALGPSVTPPPADIKDDPFNDDAINGGQGAPTVDSTDALSDAIENATPAPVAAGEAGGNTPPAGQPPAGGNPFGGDGQPAADNPFGGGQPAGDNPFGGGGGDSDAGDNPFG